MGRKFKFQLEADGKGIIHETIRKFIPFEITIWKIIFKTASNCQDRVHYTSLRINNQNIISREPIYDCQEYKVEVNVELTPGFVKFEVISDGFNPGETVTVELEIFTNYSSHFLASGETLGTVASRYGLSETELFNMNKHLPENRDLFPGTPLNIPPVDFMDIPDEKPWYYIATNEIGIVEIPGPKEHNPRILEYITSTHSTATADEIPWCSAFVNWCMVQSGYEGTYSMLARSWLQWGKKVDKPEEGHIVIFRGGTEPWQGHVGFYVSDYGPDYIRVLGGNQSNQVKISRYHRKDILGFRKP